MIIKIFIRIIAIIWALILSISIFYTLITGADILDDQTRITTASDFITTILLFLLALI